MGIEHNYLIHAGRSKSDGAAVGSGRYRLGSGKRPFQGMMMTAEQKKKFFVESSISGGKDKPKMTPAEKITKEAEKITDSSRSALDSAQHLRKITKKKQPSRAKGMTDSELRAAINRLEMERRYDSLTEEETGKGFDIAKDVLGIVGGISASAASVATIYAIASKVF